jgi:uncharacterized protein YoxC
MGEAMEISVALQIALFFASLSVIVLVACIVPIAFQTRRNSEQLLRTIEELKSNTQLLAQDSRELVRSLNDLCRRANQQMDELSQILRTAQQWTQRADRLVEEVGSAIEPPVFSLARNLNLFRTGATTFLRTLFHLNHHNQTKERGNHVRQ